MINGKYILVALCDGHGVDTAGKRTPTLPDGQKSEIGKPYMNENLFNRAVVGYVDKHLRHIGFNTLLVAPTDDDTPLHVRTALANSRDADIYVSIHANALTGEWGYHGGIETFYYPTSDSLRLSKAIHKHVMKGTKMKDRGVKNGGQFWVLRKTYMPATLVELGFMDSLHDYDELLKDSYRRESAREIVMGICEYFGVRFREMPSKKDAEPAPAPESQETMSLVDYLKSLGQPSDFNSRKALAVKHGIKNYVGSEKQNLELLAKLKKANTPSEPTVGKIDKSKAGDRVESLVDDLRFYHKPSWDKKDSAGRVGKGLGFTIIGRLDVDGYAQYKVRNSSGSVFFLTASSKFVKVVPKPKPAPKPEPKKEPKKEETGFRVVAGSFANREDADKRVSLLKGKGFDSFISLFEKDKKTYFRVVVGSFSSRENAEKRVKELKKIGIETFLVAITK
jgi:N-acetylmuramoyl-L-alanine amidase